MLDVCFGTELHQQKISQGENKQQISKNRRILKGILPTACSGEGTQITMLQCTIAGGRTEGANKKSFVFVHQHGGCDVTGKPPKEVTHKNNRQAAAANVTTQRSVATASVLFLIKLQWPKKNSSHGQNRRYLKFPIFPLTSLFIFSHLLAATILICLTA